MDIPELSVANHAVCSVWLSTEQIGGVAGGPTHRLNGGGSDRTVKIAGGKNTRRPLPLGMAIKARAKARVAVRADAPGGFGG